MESRFRVVNAGPGAGSNAITSAGSPSVWLVAIGGLVLFLLAALIKAFVAAHPPHLTVVGSLASYPTAKLTIARLVPWLTWLPLAVLVWRAVPAIDARARTTSAVLLIHALCSAIVAVVHIASTVAANVVILEPAPSLAMFANRAHWFFSMIFDWEVLTYWAILAAAYAWLFASRARERELQAAELSAQLNAERLQSLLLQLNPHFLFNTLNAVTGLIYNGQRDEAVATISRLAELLRLTLNDDLQQEIALRDEVELLRTYLAIEAVRFGDRITTSIDVPRELESAMVPMLLLQPLVENAIRHGVGKVPGPGTVLVRAAREGSSLLLRVWDSAGVLGRTGDGGAQRSGVGVSNTRERLARLYGGRARLDLSPGPEAGSLVTVTLPFDRRRGQGT